MYVTREQIANGINAYVDAMVIPQLPTAGKWIVGTAVGLSMSNIDSYINSSAFSMLGIVNDQGLVDIDKLAEAVKQNAVKYGKLQLSFPYVGTMTFCSDDIDDLRRYIV